MFEPRRGKESSYLVPLLLISALVLMAVGGIGYRWMVPTSRGMSSQQAALLIAAYLKAQDPATVHFHHGQVMPSVDENSMDPYYRLLEKAGVVKFLGRAEGGGITVALTPEGEHQLAEISGAVKTHNSDGTEAYTVPLAERQLVAISKVTMLGPDVAKVEFTWKWAPNTLGEAFDASGPIVKSFNKRDRTILIQKYGANFYRRGATRATVTFMRTDTQWRITAE